MAKKNLNLKNRLRGFRDSRLAKEAIEKTLKTTQPELIAAMQEADPDNEGIVYDADDSSKGAAYVQQNDPSEYWDEEAILTYLKRPGRKSLWMSCSTRVLDIQKFEAEVTAGNIKPALVKKMKKTGSTPSPFIRFGKITDENRST